MTFLLNPEVRKIFIAFLAILAPSIHVSAAEYESDIIAEVMESIESDSLVAPLSASSPATPGQFEVLSSNYGPRSNSLFRRSPEILTEAIDGPAYFDEVSEYVGGNQKGKSVPMTNLPLAGEIWYPKRDSKSPLVLIVHGNSDPGFEYIGRLLASRCCIVASVDETFLNPNLTREGGMRGWIILKHLELWDGWNSTDGSLFYNKVDMENIALIGMSRGGEAVSIAASLTQMDTVPKTVEEDINFDFSIKGVVALAPMDGMYPLFGTPTTFENVNYLLIHGGHDADMWQFLGSQQWQRVEFNPSDEDDSFFKSSLYVYRANHINFNQSMSRSMNSRERIEFSRPLMSIEDQEELTKVYVSAFIETTLLENDTYNPIFKDSAFATNWIPNDIYLNRYLDSSSRLIANFENENSLNNPLIDGIDIAVERELLKSATVSPQKFRAGRDSENDVAYLVWERCNSDDSYEFSVSIEISEVGNSNLGLSTDSNFIFSLGPSNLPAPLDDLECSSNLDAETLDADLSVIAHALDGRGNTTSVALDSLSSIPPLLKSDYSPLDNENWTFPQAVPKLKSFEIPVRLFVENNQRIRVSELVELRISFRSSRSHGTVIIDDIGVSNSILQ